MRRHNTLEVRLHSGTTDYSKITNFVDILCAVAYNQNKVVRAASTVTGFAKQHKLNSHYVGYINTRIQQFAGAAEENS
jgi:exoribonuclease II